MDRLSCKGTAADVADIHYRWMLWLMLFGLIHTYRIWWGNILFFYATLGLILYPPCVVLPPSMTNAAPANSDARRTPY